MEFIGIAAIIVLIYYVVVQIIENQNKKDRQLKLDRKKYARYSKKFQNKVTHSRASLSEEEINDLVIEIRADKKENELIKKNIKFSNEVKRKVEFENNQKQLFLFENIEIIKTIATMKAIDPTMLSMLYTLRVDEDFDFKKLLDQLVEYKYLSYDKNSKLYKNRSFPSEIKHPYKFDVNGDPLSIMLK